MADDRIEPAQTLQPVAHHRSSERPNTGESAIRTWLELVVRELGNHSDRLNAINVFPVADGDTGSNLYRTAKQMQDALREIPSVRGGTADLGQLLNKAARAGLETAQGNSGTLLAVALSGFAEGLEGVTNLTGEAVARSLDVARVRAWSALSEPVEGTLLSALIGAASAAARSVATSTVDQPALGRLVQVLSDVVSATGECVANTQHQLGTLAQAAVVDAGAVGMHLVLECLACAVTGRELHEDFYDALPGYAVQAPDVSSEAEQTVGVEVMCTVQLAPLAAATLRAELDSIGDSVLMTPLQWEEDPGEDEFVWRVHVHVEDQAVALDAIRGHAEPHSVSVTALSRAEH